MLWIRSYVDLEGHPKAKKLARVLGVSLPQVIGHLHLLWWWAFKFAPDGDLSEYEPEDLADAARWEGDPELFLRSLVGCGTRGGAGFIDREGETITIHDWEEHAGALFERRKRETKKRNDRRDRARKVKRVPPDTPPDTSRTKHGQPPDTPPLRGEERRREEKRREKEKDTPYGVSQKKSRENENPFPGSTPADAEVPHAKSPQVPYQKIVELFHEKCPSLPKVAKLTDARKANIRTFWRENPSFNALGEFFSRVEKSDFLTGKVDPSPGRDKPFLADMEWICKPSNRVKIQEGKYDNRKSSGSMALRDNPDFSQWAHEGETIDAEVIRRDRTG